MKHIIIVNCLAVKNKLRSAYWCVHTNNLDMLQKYVAKFGLRISTKFERVVYNPEMVSEKIINKAFTTQDDVTIGKLLGYPSPGEVFEKWWISWQITDDGNPNIANKYNTLFTFQMKNLNTKKLIKMRNLWNKTLPQYNFNFSIRYNDDYK
jgi:hypothetical protein